MNIVFLVDDEYKEILIDNEYENDKELVNDIKSYCSKEYDERINQYKITYVYPEILQMAYWDIEFNKKSEIDSICDCDLNELIMDY